MDDVHSKARTGVHVWLARFQMQVCPMFALHMYRLEIIFVDEPLVQLADIIKVISLTSKATLGFYHWLAIPTICLMQPQDKWACVGCYPNYQPLLTTLN